MKKTNVKTILLTGANGFLGSHLLNQFLKANFKIVILKRSFSDCWRIKDEMKHVKVYDLDLTNIERPFLENKIDVVVHTAVNYGKEAFNFEDLLETNLMFPIKLIDTASLHGVKYFINTDTMLSKNINEYTLSKKQALEWIKKYSIKLNVINVKSEYIYGPKDEKSKFIPWIIKSFLENKDKLPLTKGLQKRDFIFVDDVVDAYMTILQNLNKISGFCEFQVGTGKAIYVKDLVRKIKVFVQKNAHHRINTQLDFGALPYRKNEVAEINVDISALKKYRWKPKVSLDKGLSLTVKYIQSKNKNI